LSKQYKFYTTSWASGSTVYTCLETCETLFKKNSV